MYRGMDLELLDPGDDDELGFLLEALHQGGRDAPGSDHDLAAIGEAARPRLHVTMHQIVARQILADDPPQTWQTVQRLAGLGYGWHAITHMIAGLVAEDVHAAMAEHRHPNPEGYARRLDQLPAGWPAPGDRPSKDDPRHQR
jgi:hypothetical protein